MQESECDGMWEATGQDSASEHDAPPVLRREEEGVRREEAECGGDVDCERSELRK